MKHISIELLSYDKDRCIVDKSCRLDVDESKAEAIYHAILLIVKGALNEC